MTVTEVCTATNSDVYDKDLDSQVSRLDCLGSIPYYQTDSKPVNHDSHHSPVRVEYVASGLCQRKLQNWKILPGLYGEELLWGRETWNWQEWSTCQCLLHLVLPANKRTTRCQSARPWFRCLPHYSTGNAGNASQYVLQSSPWFIHSAILVARLQEQIVT